MSDPDEIDFHTQMHIDQIARSLKGKRRVSIKLLATAPIAPERCPSSTRRRVRFRLLWPVAPDQNRRGHQGCQRHRDRQPLNALSVRHRNLPCIRIGCDPPFLKLARPEPQIKHPS